MKLMARKLRLKKASPRTSKRSDGIRTITRKISRTRIKRPQKSKNLSITLDYLAPKALTLKRKLLEHSLSP